MPQMGLEVSEATVLAVLVAPGDRVSEGQPLLEIETEKAVAEVVAPCDGFIVSLAVTEGDTVQVGVAAAQIGDTADAVAGEDAGGDDVAPAAMVDASASVQVAAEPHAPATMVRAAPVA